MLKAVDADGRDYYKVGRTRSSCLSARFHQYQGELIPQVVILGEDDLQDPAGLLARGSSAPPWFRGLGFRGLGYRGLGV